MPQTLSKALTRRLLRSNRFRRQLWDLHTLSGMEALFLDPLGNERIRIPREHALPIHRLGHDIPRLAEHLALTRQKALAASQGEDTPPPWFEIIHPLTIDGEPVGYLALSACRDPTFRLTPLKTLWLRFVSEGIDLPWQTLRLAWEHLPPLPRERRHAWKRNLVLQGREALRLFEDESGSLPDSDALPPRISQVCRDVQSRYMEPLTLRQLAAELGVSPEHLSRLFHQHTGLRFREYLAETRVNAAKEALRHSPDLVSEIAGRCGFSTLSRFNRAFRTLTGTTPRDYRKRGHFSEIRS